MRSSPCSSIGRRRQVIAPLLGALLLVVAVSAFAQQTVSIPIPRKQLLGSSVGRLAGQPYRAQAVSCRARRQQRIRAAIAGDRSTL